MHLLEPEIEIETESTPSTKFAQNTFGHIKEVEDWLLETRFKLENMN